MLKKIKVEIYHTEVWFFISPKRDKVDEFCRKYNIPKINGSAIGATFVGNDTHVVIWVKSLKDFSTLAHEITHACFTILCRVGIDVDCNNHEALTYLQSFLIDKVLK